MLMPARSGLHTAAPVLQDAGERDKSASSWSDTWKPRPRRQASIPTRIFFGSAVVLVVFAGVAAASLIEHAHTAENLRLLNEGYLPLALVVGEAKATQAVFTTLLERTVQEQDAPATRNWIHAALRVRKVTIVRAVAGMDHLESLTPRSKDRILL